MPIREAWRTLEREAREETGYQTRDRRLAALLRHASEAVPYYAALLRGHEAQLHRTPLDVLQSLPVLSREAVRTEFASLHSADLDRRRTFQNTTGGSTGEPVVLTQDADYAAWSVAGLLQNWALMGRSFGEPAYWLWGSERDVLEGSEQLRRRALNRLTGDRWLNAFRMSDAAMRDWVDQLATGQAPFMAAYAQSAYEFAHFLEEHDLRLRPLRGIMTSAGTLHPFMRDKIEAQLGGRVFDRYGSREAGSIATEVCQAGYLHVFPWSVHVEVVDEQGVPLAAGETGEILITSLVNYAMPLIRYAIGDRGHLHPEPQCVCGWQGQVLRGITGRVVDSFLTHDGTRVDGEYFTHLLYFRDWVRKFQVIQRTTTLIDFIVVLNDRREPAPAELEEIRTGARAVMGECEIRFRFTDDIEPSASGKYRYTLSELAPEQPSTDLAGSG
jgi:phenylacetate-CoA ligase